MNVAIRPMAFLLRIVPNESAEKMETANIWMATAETARNTLILIFDRVSGLMFLCLLGIAPSPMVRSRGYGEL